MYLEGLGEFCVDCGADSVLSDLGLAAASLWFDTSISALNGTWLGGLRNLMGNNLESQMWLNIWSNFYFISNYNIILHLKIKLTLC